MFELFADGTLKHAASRRAFLNALQVWLDGIEGVLVSRQASCSDPTYLSAFREQLHGFIKREGARKGSAAHRGRRETPRSTR